MSQSAEKYLVLPCTMCGKRKPHSAFYKDKRRGPTGKRRGAGSRCKDCVNKIAREKHASRTKAEVAAINAGRREYRRAYKLMKSYGITVEEYDRLLHEQDGRCASCGDLFTDDNTPRVDHDHDTGQVRGLLCHGDNVAMGFLREDVTRALALIDYMKDHL